MNVKLRVIRSTIVAMALTLLTRTRRIGRSDRIESTLARFNLTGNVDIIEIAVTAVG